MEGLTDEEIRIFRAERKIKKEISNANEEIQKVVTEFTSIKDQEGEMERVKKLQKKLVSLNADIYKKSAELASL